MTVTFTILAAIELTCPDNTTLIRDVYGNPIGIKLPDQKIIKVWPVCELHDTKDPTQPPRDIDEDELSSLGIERGLPMLHEALEEQVVRSDSSAPQNDRPVPSLQI